jgi:hypothetical protein
MFLALFICDSFIKPNVSFPTPMPPHFIALPF